MVPKRDGKGSNILGPDNPERAEQSYSLVRPPVTDGGKMPNMKWYVYLEWEIQG